MTGLLQRQPATRPAAPSPEPAPVASVVVVSFNTRDLLRECLCSLRLETAPLGAEIIVVDNASRDGSAAMVEAEFPGVTVLRSETNLGFGNANNLGFSIARGRYIVLLNSDAFLAKGALAGAIQHMDKHPRCALGGGRLVGRDGAAQPSARCFHTVAADAAVYTGLASWFPKSHFFGRLDRTWADPGQPAEVDWVPGAFSIVRPQALRQIGGFDPAFFLYYEEVDLCRRFKSAGFQVWYWPDVVITHIGGESAKAMDSRQISTSSSQVALWRMRSMFLYYRKHHGRRVYLARWTETLFYTLALWRNLLSGKPYRVQRAQYFAGLRRMMRLAWNETSHGRVSPPVPW